MWDPVKIQKKGHTPKHTKLKHRQGQLLDWEKAFDKVSQSKVIRAIRRLGIAENIINMIKTIYLAPNYVITEKDVTTTSRIQKTGIRQECPLSPYLFIMLMTAIMHDVESSLTEQELETTNRDRLHKQVNGKLFYADGTIIMAKTAEPVEIIVHKIEL